MINQDYEITYFEDIDGDRITILLLDDGNDWMFVISNGDGWVETGKSGQLLCTCELLSASLTFKNEGAKHGDHIHRLVNNWWMNELKPVWDDEEYWDEFDRQIEINQP